jgi:Phage protein Gp138 N-terminal domain
MPGQGIIPKIHWLRITMTESTNPLLGNTSSDKQRLLGALLSALRSHELTSDQLLPAVIQSFDRVNNIAVVQPLVQWVDVDNNQYNRHQLVGINVLSLGGGGFNISFPLKQGDLGWILAADRDISLFKQSLQNAAPNTGRLHSFEDGWFVPDVLRNYSINSADSAAMVIQSVDSTTRISISEGSITITTPSAVNLVSPNVTTSGNLSAGSGVTGTLTSTTGKVGTFQNGILTNIS